MCFTSQDAILVQKAYQFTVKLRGQQVTTTKEPPWAFIVWCVCVVQFDNKINDSYTKREGASVQGVQQ